ncbi:hypothetical protein [Dictyobacter halimunensis]
MDAKKAGLLIRCPAPLAMLPGYSWLHVSYHINTPTSIKYRFTGYI